MHQAAWLLHTAALQLHRADLALASHRDDCKLLLQAFFGTPDEAADDGNLLY